MKNKHTKVIKSFSLTEEEAYIIEKEAKQQGISQSELIRKLLSNTESSYQKKKAEQIETLFLKILRYFNMLTILESI